MREPAGEPRFVDPRPARRLSKWRQHLLFWPVVVGLVYLIVTLAVTAAEYFSEMSKVSRGFFSDTFSPFMYTHLLTFPTSAIHRDWHGYPVFFDQAQFRRILRDAAGPVVLNVVIEAVLVAAVVLLFVARTQRRGPQPD
jgi:hypothetical protein